MSGRLKIVTSTEDKLFMEGTVETREQRARAQYRIFQALVDAVR